MITANKYTPKTPRREKTNLSNDGDKKDNNVQVFCRLRTLKEDKIPTCIKVLSPTVLALTTPQVSKSTRKEIHCKFKHIFTAYSSQNEVFEHIAYPLLEDLLKGTNALLFTYGLTGSGKTHSLTGERNNPGIMPKCIYTIFNTISNNQAPKFVIKSDRMNGFELQSEQEATRDKLYELRSTKKTPKNRVNKEKLYHNDGLKVRDIDQNNLYSVFVSYTEIYNNKVYDLLDENVGHTMQGKILREDSNKNMYVNGVVEVEVKSADEAFDMFNEGQRKKRMGNTVLNSESSRSHSTFNIRVVQFQKIPNNAASDQIIPDSNQLKVAQLSLVDLAGSERTSRTQNTGKLLREASHINNSLMTLRTCLEILRENQQTGSYRLVPYRDSRLTLLFKNYFEGEGRVEMIVCVNPSVEDFEENLHVMKFAENIQDVKIMKSASKYRTPMKTPKSIKKSTTYKLRSISSFNLGPKLPEIKLNFENQDESNDAMDKLLSILKIRQQKLRNLDDELNKREQYFRKNFIELSQENVVTISELKGGKTLLKKNQQRDYNLETNLADVDHINVAFDIENEEFHSSIIKVESTITGKDHNIDRNLILQHEKIKQKLALTNEEMIHEFDPKLRGQREDLKIAMEANDHELKNVRDILICVTSPEIEEINQPIVETPVLKTPQRSHIRIACTPASSKHRRSRSVGAEICSEYNSIEPVDLGTMLQPSMRKRKCVSKLNKASDFINPKQSKYCLIDQEQDFKLETRLYKGDISPTCGGGVQIDFNGVEKLKQAALTKLE